MIPVFVKKQVVNEYVFLLSKVHSTFSKPNHNRFYMHTYIHNTYDDVVEFPKKSVSVLCYLALLRKKDLLRVMPKRTLFFIFRNEGQGS